MEMFSVWLWRCGCTSLSGDMLVWSNAHTHKHQTPRGTLNKIVSYTEINAFYREFVQCYCWGETGKDPHCVSTASQHRMQISAKFNGFMFTLINSTTRTHVEKTQD